MVQISNIYIALIIMFIIFYDHELFSCLGLLNIFDFVFLILINFQ